MQRRFLDIFGGKLPRGYNFTVGHIAHGGKRIAGIRHDLPAIVAFKPDACLVYFDSDASDVEYNGSGLSDEEVKAIREQYVIDLKYVIETILSTGTFLAVGGPEILGEGPIGKTFRFWGTRDVVLAYEDMTRSIVKSYNIEYMDIRQAFLNTIPTWYQIFLFLCIALKRWYFNQGIITQDGEHGIIIYNCIILTIM